MRNVLMRNEEYFNEKLGMRNEGCFNKNIYLEFFEKRLIFRIPHSSFLIKLFILFFFFQSCVGKSEEIKKIKVGAERTEIYLPLLKNKKVAIVSNQSSLIGKKHLVDSLLKLKINIVKIFCPEHGFRGKADAGEHVNSYTDKKTGLKVISLFGKNKKARKKDLKNIDIIIFDIQDVGVRFYTYTSTMHYMMESCSENNIQMLIFDRPNPNGFYVDGNILDMKFKSFVGMHPVPIVHGLTIGEYAKMINGEKWLKNGIKCDLKIIPCENYTHKDLYELPIKPSPNLPNISSIYLYPSLCLFEGTPISIGRGTDFPFQVFGHPSFKNDTFIFIPKITEGSKYPKFKNKKCFGFDLRKEKNNILNSKKINLSFLIESYKKFEKKGHFFKKFFSVLAGGKTLENQIKKNLSEKEIRKTWEKDLRNFKILRKKYLIYEDF